MRNHKPPRRLLSGAARIAALVWLIAPASIAHAHGAMAGPDEIGPPLFTSAALGFLCYWVVILWPSSKSKDDAPTITKSSANRNRRGTRRSAGSSSDPQHSLRLRKIAGREKS